MCEPAFAEFHQVCHEAFVVLLRAGACCLKNARGAGTCAWF